MTNQYEDSLIAELHDDLGDFICAADWHEFWGAIRNVDKSASVHAGIIGEHDEDRIDEAVNLVYEWAFNTRADLPSIRAYIWQQIENDIAELNP